MINVRDLTDQEGLYESKAKIKQLQQAVERLSNELDDPISVVKKNVGELHKSYSSVLEHPMFFQKRLDEIQNFTKFSSLKIKNFKDFGEIGTNHLKANVNKFDVEAIIARVIQVASN